MLLFAALTLLFNDMRPPSFADYPQGGLQMKGCGGYS